MEGEAILQVKTHCCFSPLLPWLRCIWRGWMSHHWSSRCPYLSSTCVFFQPPSSPRNLSNTVCNQHPTRPSASAFFLRAYSPLHAFFIRFHLAPTFAILHCGLYGNVLYHSFTLGKCFKSFLQSSASVERACVHITVTALSYSNPHGSGAADRLIRCDVCLCCCCCPQATVAHALHHRQKSSYPAASFVLLTAYPAVSLLRIDPPP